jgi:hypothetical protein
MFDTLYPHGFAPDLPLYRLGGEGPCMVCGEMTDWWLGELGWLCGPECLKLLERRRSA